MNSPTNRDPTPPNDSGGEETLSGRYILIVLTLVALACVGGYFFLLKLIDISRQEDCFLANRKNCMPTETPFRR
jgi:hypothetical protein